MSFKNYYYSHRRPVPSSLANVRPLKINYYSHRGPVPSNLSYVRPLKINYYSHRGPVPSSLSNVRPFKKFDWCSFLQQRSHFAYFYRLTAIHLLLEAFGNSRTVMNATATRFTEIFSVDFDHSGLIVSASIQVRNTFKMSSISLLPLFCPSPLPIDEITIKTPNPKCRLYWCLIEFIDWRYSQSCWYFWPLLWTSAPLPSLPFTSSPPTLCE